MGEEHRLLQGNAVSRGIAMAEAYVYEPLDLTIIKGICTKEEVETECKRFYDAMNRAKDELERLYDILEKEHPEQAKIFAAHKELLDDEEMIE